MKRRSVWFVAAALLVVVIAIGTHGIGFSARAAPSSLEATLLLAARRWATPPTARARTNPVAKTPDVLHEAMAHWADHCAICHDNDGTGRTSIGRSLYPRAPDMRTARTQGLTDGELFYIIERGVPLTGMPAWSTGTEEGELASWKLVHFIRHLPQVTDMEVAEMEKLNPKSAEQLEQERRADDFLKGKGGR